MEENYGLEEPSDDFRYLPADDLTAIRTNHREIRSITHQNSLTRWLNLEGFPLRESYYFVVGLGCDSHPLLVLLSYDADSNSYVYHHVELANGDELKRFWCN